MTIDRIELDHAGFRELLRSDDVLDLVKQEAEALADAAGPGMEADAFVGSQRVVGGVITGTTEARLAEVRSETRALTRALASRSGP